MSKIKPNTRYVFFVLAFGLSSGYYYAAGQNAAIMLHKLETLSEKGDFTGSIELEEEINSLVGVHDSLKADLYSYLGGAFYEGFILDKAATYFHRELTYRKNLPPDYRLFDCLYNLLYVLEENGEIEKAIGSSLELQAMAVELYGDGSPEYYEASTWHIDLLITNSQYSGALKTTEAILKKCSKENDYYAILLSKKGEAQLLLGNYSTARESLILSHTMLVEHEMYFESLLVKSKIALTYVDQGKYAQAESIFLEVESALTQLDDPLAREALYDLYNLCAPWQV